MPLEKDDRDANEALNITAMEWVRLLASGKQTQADMMQFQLWHDSSPQHTAIFQHIQNLNASLEPVSYTHLTLPTIYSV